VIKSEKGVKHITQQVKWEIFK